MCNFLDYSVVQFKLSFIHHLQKQKNIRLLKIIIPGTVILSHQLHFTTQKHFFIRTLETASLKYSFVLIGVILRVRQSLTTQQEIAFKVFFPSTPTFNSKKKVK